MEKMRKENDTVKKELEKIKKEHSELLKSSSVLENIESNLRKEINILESKRRWRCVLEKKNEEIIHNYKLELDSARTAGEKKRMDICDLLKEVDELKKDKKEIELNNKELKG